MPRPGWRWAGIRVESAASRGLDFAKESRTKQFTRTGRCLLGLSARAIGPAAAQEKQGAGQSGGTAAAAKVGQPAPDFTLLDCDGKKHKLSDYRDKIVVLQWVNQQCPFSVGAIPVVKDLQKKFAGKGVVWLGIESTHWRKPEENIQYVKDKQLDFPILMDNDGQVGRMYGAKVTPHMYVINQGTLVYAGGLHEKKEGEKKEGVGRNYTEEAIQAALDGKPVPLAETTPWGCTVKYKPEGEKKDNPPAEKTEAK